MRPVVALVAYAGVLLAADRFVGPGGQAVLGTVTPGVGIPDGNPPSGAASGCVLFDILAMALAPLAAARRRWGLQAA